MQRAEHDDRQWEAFFSQNSITPLRIAYEDYTDRIEPVVQKIADFLGVGIPEIHEPQKSDYRKLSDSTSERWVERYLELSSGKTGSGAPSQTTNK